MKFVIHSKRYQVHPGKGIKKVVSKSIKTDDFYDLYLVYQSWSFWRYMSENIQADMVDTENEYAFVKTAQGKAKLCILIRMS